MALDTNAVSVTTAATLLASVPAVTSAAVGSSGKSNVTVSNPTGGQIVFLGGSTVTASGAKQGIPLAVGASITLALAYDDVLYGIVAATTQTVNVLTAMA